MDADSQQLARKYVFKDHGALWRLSVRSDVGAIRKRGDPPDVADPGARAVTNGSLRANFRMAQEEKIPPALRDRIYDCIR
jgi:hypothetical protein